MISTTTTVVLLLILAALAVAYDIFAEIKNNDFTISFIIGLAARKAPIIALVFGIIMGHFFWSQCLP